MYKTKYIFVTGGVLSGLGKGIMAASMGAILKARGLKVNIQKLDPYLNVDAGTLNPAEHGEVFVTEDGAETDLDLGHYERFLDQNLTQKSSLMSGKVFQHVIEKERRGGYLGKTVQVCSHLTVEIQNMIMDSAKGSDVHIVEVGGTIGDYEGVHFIEAIRQMRRKIGAENCLYVHLAFLPYLETSKEIKTKPAQNSVRDLMNLGIHPDIIGARCDRPIKKEQIEKLSLFCDVEEEAVIPLPTIKNVYEVPLNLEKAKLGEYIVKKLGIKAKRPDLSRWTDLMEKIDYKNGKITIGMVAKYLSNEDTYKSITEALRAAGWKAGVTVDTKWIDSEALENGKTKGLLGIDGMVVLPGFGTRGIEGKILAARYARENNIPYLGICLGMQVAVIEFARNVCGIKKANTEEIEDKCPEPVIHFIEEQKKNIHNSNYGGSMRLGSFDCTLSKNSISHKLYGKDKISERHRHRYEFNNKYKVKLEKCGLKISGINPKYNLVEIVEIPEHPFFVACQFHPEFKSRPYEPRPLFEGLVRSAVGYKKSNELAGPSTVFGINSKVAL